MHDHVVQPVKKEESVLNETTQGTIILYNSILNFYLHL